MLISSPSLMAVWACTAILLFYISSISFACMLRKLTDGVFLWPSLNVETEKIVRGGQKQFSWSGLNFWEISFGGQYLSLCHWSMQHQYQNGSKKQCVLVSPLFNSHLKMLKQKWQWSYPKILLCTGFEGNFWVRHYIPWLMKGKRCPRTFVKETDQ